MANILVVDDELGIRELLFEILNDEGHGVILAENAQQARMARLSSQPDLVLLDIWMPDQDGVSLLKDWVRQGMLTMPVIMMSGHATIETAVAATKMGAFAFLEKPITMQKLLSSVEAGLASRNSNKQYMEAVAPAATPADSAEQTSNTALEPTLEASMAPQVRNVSAQVNYNHFFDLDVPLREARDKFERIYFEYHLTRENGSMTKVSEKTGLERTHLYRKLRQLGVERNKAGSSDSRR